jgi:hypothetical protein
MSGQYVVGQKMRQSDGSTSAVYLGWIGAGETPDFGWAAGGRKGAARFTGREDALDAAKRLEATIRSRGYQPERIVVLPLSGGVAVTRREAIHAAD